MSTVIFINGSPRREESCSHYLMNETCKLIKDKTVDIKELYVKDIINNKDLYEEILNCKKLVFNFPLYIDTMPATVIDFLIQFEEYIHSNNISDIEIYGIANCGFLEGIQNESALRILRNFTNRAGLIWGFGVGIGAGEHLMLSQRIGLNTVYKRKIYNAIKELSLALVEDYNCPRENIYAEPKVSKRFFIFMANRYWIGSAKKNRLKKLDLYDRPYNV